LYGFHSVKKNFSTGDWLKKTIKLIKQIHNKNKIPILVGGTGLYFRAIINGLVKIPAIPKKYRNQIRNNHRKIGQKKFYNNLIKLDPLVISKINANDVKLWLILAEAQIANKQYENALNSLNKAEQINSNISEIYFAKSNVYLKISQQTKAKIALEKGIKIEPNNHKAIFQLGNILLMEKNYSEAIKLFDRSVKIKPDFWQAINNQGLAYFERNNVNLSIKLFESAISIEENAEPLLGLASCINFMIIN